MENILANIISIERKAQEQVSAAQKTCDTMVQQAKKDQKAMEQDILSRRDGRLAKIRQYEADCARKKLDTIYAAGQQAQARLETAYERNQETWINEIFAEIIGR